LKLVKVSQSYGPYKMTTFCGQMKRNDWQENHQLTLKRNNSHCNHLIVVKTWQGFVNWKI